MLFDCLRHSNSPVFILETAFACKKQIFCFNVTLSFCSVLFSVYLKLDTSMHYPGGRIREVAFPQGNEQMSHFK